jgi:hypothetical protein
MIHAGTPLSRMGHEMNSITDVSQQLASRVAHLHITVDDLP